MTTAVRRAQQPRRRRCGRRGGGCPLKAAAPPRRPRHRNLGRRATPSGTPQKLVFFSLVHADATTAIAVARPATVTTSSPLDLAHGVLRWPARSLRFRYRSEGCHCVQVPPADHDQATFCEGEAVNAPTRPVVSRRRPNHRLSWSAPASQDSPLRTHCSLTAGWRSP